MSSNNGNKICLLTVDPNRVILSNDGADRKLLNAAFYVYKSDRNWEWLLSLVIYKQSNKTEWSGFKQVNG